MTIIKTETLTTDAAGDTTTREHIEAEGTTIEETTDEKTYNNSRGYFGSINRCNHNYRNNHQQIQQLSNDGYMKETSRERPKSASYLKNSAYCELFHLLLSAEKSRKGFTRNWKTVFFLHWKHQKKLICF